MTTLHNEILTGLNENNYIHCNCSDCGHERVKGPCYLEKYFSPKNTCNKNNDNIYKLIIDYFNTGPNLHLHED